VRAVIDDVANCLATNLRPSASSKNVNLNQGCSAGVKKIV
jgi:hypothetical protein